PFCHHHHEETMKRDLQNSELNSLLPDVQVDRRGFVAACIAAGFAVSAEPVLAQAIKTPMDGLDGGEIKIGDMPAYYALPKGGGRMVWMYSAHQPKMKAGVAWYGGLSPAQPAISTTPVDIVGQLKAPVLGLYGGADQGIPPDQVEKLRAALQSGDKAAKQSQLQVYEGAPHGFNADY